MNNPTFQQFQADALGRGFDEVLERKWQANTVLEDHAHPFKANALVVQGEMWLAVGDQTQHLLQGDRFVLERDVPHSERNGPEGATYWVARRKNA